MITHPKTEELVRSVALWLEQIRPTLDPRNGFLARVAGNALATVERELTQGPAAEAEAITLMGDLLGRDGLGRLAEDHQPQVLQEDQNGGG